MRKMRLFLAVVVLATCSILKVHARAVGDRFTVNKVTYEITSVENLTVGICDFTLTGAVSFPATAADSTNTIFRVTSIIGEGGIYDHFTGNKTAITSLTFPEGFETLYPSAIRNFDNLTTINLPSTFKELGSASILVDVKLTAINVPSGNPYFKTVGGALYSKDGTILYKYPEGSTVTSLTIPSGVTTVGKYSIACLQNLTTITIPASVTEMQQGFNYSNHKLSTISVNASNPRYSSVSGMLCSKSGDTLLCIPPAITTATLTIPSQIKVLSKNCGTFVKATHLLLPGVEVIERGAFAGCSFQDVTLYPSLREIQNYEVAADGSIIPSTPFGTNNSAFKKFILSGTSNYFAVDGNGVLYSKDYTRLIVCPAYNGVKNYTTNSNTTYIDHGAFYNHRSLQSITITKNVEEIGRSALAFSTQNYFLENVVFEDNSQLRKIDPNGFALTKIKEIILPTSLDTIGFNAFKENLNLKTVYIKSGSQLALVDSTAFLNCTALETFEFLGTHTADSLSIGDRAFANCSKLVGNSEGTFFFPAAVWHIGESAFNGCSSLTSVTFQQTSTKQPKLENIGFAAFQNSGLLSITLPRSVKRVGNEAFNSCYQLKTVSIPAATNYVGPQAFVFCSQLKEILVDKNNTKYSSVDGMLASKDKKTLYTFPAGKAATYYTMLSPSFETINDSAFYYNRALKSVTIPKKVKKIGAHAFALCDNLERINFLADNPITDVHAEAFIDMQKQSRLPNIDLYVRNGHKGTYQSSSFWGNAKSVNESFITASADLGRVEYFPMSSTDVSIVAVSNSPTSEDMTTFVVPQTVTQGGSTYNVKLIGDYAFENSDTNIDEVVVPKGVQLNYIGARAFVKGNSSPTIKSIFLVNSTPADLATSVFGLHDAGVTPLIYDEVAAGQAIYVKKSAETAFKTAWPTMAGKIGYQIPLSMPNAFSTFAREFDADFSEYSDGNTSTLKPGWPKVVAFTAGEYKTDGKDASGNPMNYIIMQSINADATGAIGTEGDGTYIPAGTGVLLKAIDGAANVPQDFYYQIYDDDVKTALSPYAGENLLRGITVSTKEVQPTEGGKTNFIVSGNQLHKMTFARWIPAHKSYLQVPTSMIPTTTGAKMMFFFKGLDDNVVTAIDGSRLTLESSDNGDIYDLQGRRVTAPAKGIYVRNGKKVIIK